MAVYIGKIGKVTCGTTAVGGTYTIAEMGTYTLSGFTREALESTAFGDDIKEYTFGVGDGGEISFSGNYDPTDASGQEYLNSHCSNGSTLVSGQIRFYTDNTSYFTLSAGTLLVTKTKAVSFDKAGIGTVEFSGKISGGSLVRI